MSGPVDLRTAITEASRRLAEAGVASPRVDAEILAAHVLGIDRKTLVLADVVDSTSYKKVVERRAAREPLQHITGVAHFRSVDLRVGPGVFVPRPETEVVVGHAIDHLGLAGLEHPVVVDLCTGSGAIASAVAAEVQGAVVHAVELSPDALTWAAANLEGTGVTLHAADVADALPDLDGAVDVVVSNPPYVPVDAVIRDAEVAEHDPAIALWGGVDGLDVVHAVVATAARLLRDGGLLVVEHADVQGQSLPALLRSTGDWDGVADHTDLAGRDRYATATRAVRSRP